MKTELPETPDQKNMRRPGEIKPDINRMPRNDTASRIIASMIALHRWRDAYNGNSIGRGLDPYKADEECYYPEAYAEWGKGYLSLFQVTNLQKFLDLSEQAAAWLLQHPNPGYEGLSWGLPWVWEQWKTTDTLSYLITTVIVGELFLSLYKVTHKEEYICASRSIAQWIEQENGGGRNKTGLWFHYANHPPLRIPVVNPTAKASGFFADLFLVTNENHYKEIAQEAARWALNQQRYNGSWFYSAERKRIDNLHTGFILDGLWKTDQTIGVNGKSKLLRGTQYYWDHFFTPDGRGNEMKPFTRDELTCENVNAWVRHRQSDNIHKPETRLWGYGSAIEAFVSASRLDIQWRKKAIIIYDHINTMLLLEEGGYAYRSDDKRTFIRHQAHIFAAFGCLVKCLTVDGAS